MQREIAKILRFVKGLTWNGFLRLNKNNGTPLPYSELPSIIKSAISEDGDGVFNSLDIDSTGASIDSSGNIQTGGTYKSSDGTEIINSSRDATFNSLDIDGNASINSSGDATVNSITNNGYEKKNVTTISIPSYYITSSDNIILVVEPGQPVSITLPTPSAGRQLTIKDKAGNAPGFNITINQNDDEHIDGADSYTIDTAYGSVTLVSDGADWFITSEV